MNPNLEKAHAAPRCQHILFDDKPCTQPALHGRRACRFHYGLGDVRAAFPMIEDGLSLQVALNQVARGILDGSLDRKTATSLLYCFQIMSTNLKQMNAERKLSQKDKDDDDIPGPSLAQILLDRLTEMENEMEDANESEAHESPSDAPLVAQDQVPGRTNQSSVIPSAAEGPFVSSAAVVRPSCPSCEPPTAGSPAASEFTKNSAPHQLSTEHSALSTGFDSRAPNLAHLRQ